MPEKGIEWGMHLSTGVTCLDDEHKDLIAHYCSLVDALDHGEDTSSFEDAFRRLMASAREHFAHEERVMRNIGFSHYRNHKEEHEKLLNDADDFVHNIIWVLTKEDCSAIAEYFRFWLMRHIEDQDRRIYEHIHRAD